MTGKIVNKEDKNAPKIELEQLMSNFVNIMLHPQVGFCSRIEGVIQVIHHNILVLDARLQAICTKLDITEENVTDSYNKLAERLKKYRETGIDTEQNQEPENNVEEKKEIDIELKNFV